MTNTNNPEQPSVKDTNKENKENNQTYATLGLVFAIIGFATMNFAFLAVGIVFFIIGTTDDNDPFNIKNWFGNKPKSEETPNSSKPEPFTRDNLTNVEKNKTVDDVEYLDTDENKDNK
jgi:hypothetical protein